MITASQTRVEIVEVGLRDGLQSIANILSTKQKVSLLRDLYEAGVRRMEVTSFVSASAVPQMADAAEVYAASQALSGLDAHVLVPTVAQAQRAFSAGARHVAFVVSVSTWHNQQNVRRSPIESLEQFAGIVAMAPAGVRFRANVATAFDCPRLGRMIPEDTMNLVARLELISPGIEVAFCDTTGRADPLQVGRLFGAARARFPATSRWAFHGHDTYGLGAANAFAAWQAGVAAIDASFAGLGGCPFAPGATGNVATEDIVWMFERMGVDSGVNLTKLLAVARQAALIPGAQLGGRVRDSLGVADKAKLENVS